MIYVDPLVNNGWIIRGRSTPNCHMFSDSNDEELHAFAVGIGLQVRWFQAKQALRHYDLTPAKRAAAITNGAGELDRYQMGMYLREIRAKGHYETPVNKVTLDQRYRDFAAAVRARHGVS